MALQPFLTSLDEAPEGLRDHYVERDGRYVLDVTPQDGWALEDVAGLKRNLEDRKERQRQAAEELKRFEGLDPDEARAALNRPKNEDLENHVTSVREELEKKHAKEREKYEQTRSQLEGQVQKLLVDSEVARLLNTKDLKGDYELLIEPIRKRVKTESGDDGQMRLRVLGEDGQPMYAPKGNSVDEAGLEDLLRSMREDKRFQRAFDGTGATGGGATGAGSPVNGQRTTDTSLPPIDRLRAAFEGAGQQ